VGEEIMHHHPDCFGSTRLLTDIADAKSELLPWYELEQFFQPEEEGLCIGTILIVICLGLGIKISMSQKRGGRYEF
jgi:hypothetical protein